MSVTTCPKCGRPVGGRARVCGYCGESLIQEYFQKSAKSLPLQEERGSLGLLSCILGVAGAVFALAGAIFHLLSLYGFGPENLRPEMDLNWWIRSALGLLPVTAYLGRRLALGRRGGPLLGEGIWLALASAGLTGCLLYYFGQGSAWFYGIWQIPYLFSAGCGMIALAQLAAIGNSRFLWRTNNQ